MLESVCIVLNEREPSKAKAAESLVSKLSAENITASRVEVDSQIEDVIAEKCPKILILDYLLGDYSTGLDILQKLHTLEESLRPKTIFLTDEPSVSVAVQAMRLGAVHYLEIHNPQAVSNVVKEVKEILASENCKASIKAAPVIRLGDLIAHSKPMQKLIERIKTLAMQNTPIVVFEGPKGCGKSTLAAALQHARQSTSRLIKLDLSSFDRDLSEFIPSCQNGDLALQLGHNLSLIVTQAEEDDGQLLNSICDAQHNIWPADGAEHYQSFLTLCTTNPETSKAWGRLTQAEILQIPPLNEARKEDFPALVQRFVAEASSLSNQKLKPLESSLVKWLASLTWTDNILQLRAVVIDAALTSSFSKEDLKALIEERMSLWESSKPDLAAPDLSSLTAATMLEMSNFNYRIAAAKLGCSTQMLRDIIAAKPITSVGSQESPSVST
ncbi:sigma 54-interacting transcriptional regulator [Oligoflexia bacterium]|nr:sigma 54-interacting transcriptional regulator [Oligoflexia bacterium]